MRVENSVKVFIAVGRSYTKSGPVRYRRLKGTTQKVHYAMRRLLLASLVGLLGCGHSPAAGPFDAPPDASADAPFGPLPALAAMIPEYDFPVGDTVWAVSDIHGGYDRLAELLAAAHILAEVPRSPAEAIWTGRTGTLLVLGDLIDKGPQSLAVISLLQTLEAQAALAGGRVVVTLGNHEAEFFVDAFNSKAAGSDGINKEFQVLGVDPSAVASGQMTPGDWLRARPFGARVGPWFFAHAGNPQGLTIRELQLSFALARQAHEDFNDPFIVGAQSLLEARAWYGSPAVVQQYLQALGVAHVVFGHDPNALGARGDIAVAQAGSLFRIDCGMSPTIDDSKGRLLQLRRPSATRFVAEQVTPSGATTLLWQDP